MNGANRWQVSFRAPKPITTAESDEHWAYFAADLKAVRNIFGSPICDAVESAPVRIREIAKTPTRQTTECVRTNFPQQNFQDAIVWLDVGSAGELAGTLFPRIDQRSLLTHQEIIMQAAPMSGHQGISTSVLDSGK